MRETPRGGARNTPRWRAQQLRRAANGVANPTLAGAGLRGDKSREHRCSAAFMAILYVLVPLATLLAGVALVAFRWAVRSGQFDDLETPPLRAVFEEPPSERPS